LKLKLVPLFKLVHNTLINSPDDATKVIIENIL
jgi:hypothetical protein